MAPFLSIQDPTMPFSPEQIQELDVLFRYRLDSNLQGIKVHKTAQPEVIDAVKRLHKKGLITQVDGGYLTDLGRQAAEHAQTLMLILGPAYDKAS
jgi:uncharacterized protein (TIGR02647 family)